MTMRAGWYPSPDDPTELKYWDGEDWTEHTQASPDAPTSIGDDPEVGSTDDEPEVESTDDEPEVESTDDDSEPDTAEQSREGDSTPEESEVPGLDESSPVPDDDGWDHGPESRSALGWVTGVVITSAIVVGGFVVLSALWGGDDQSSLEQGAIVGDGVEPGDAEGTVVGTTSSLATFTVPTTTRFAIATTTTVANADTDSSTSTTSTLPTSTTTAATSTTAVAPAEREVTLLVDVAKLRAGPRLNAAEVDTIADLGGTSIVVLGEPVDGWYEVRIGTKQGWMFGAFILPPADGLTVLQTRSGAPVTLLDASGQASGVASASGSYALATSTAGELWPVILPEGGTGYVNAPDMNIRS